MDTRIEDLKFYAGLFDGEGSFAIILGERIYKDRRWINLGCVARIGMKHAKSQLMAMRDFFDIGSIYCSNVGTDKEIDSWQTTKWADLKSFATLLKPHLRFKQNQALMIIEACELHNDIIPGWKMQSGTPSRTKETMLKIIQLALDMNPLSVQATGRKNLKPLSYWSKVLDDMYTYREIVKLNVGGMPRKYTDNDLFIKIRNINKGGCSKEEKKRVKELAKYRFGAWDTAVELAEKND